MKPEEIFAQLKSYLKEEWYESSNKKSEITDKGLSLIELENKCRICNKCDLYKTAKNLVFSDGNPEAKIVFIGEAPGADEDEQGKPFVGKAGKLLTASIEEKGLKRSKVYICNILKHRPPENRNPIPNEISACTPYLVEQLSIIKPALIITLGNFSTKFILNTMEGISKLRGNIKKSPLGYNILPTYHPAAILRNMNLIEDFKRDISKAIEFIVRK